MPTPRRSTASARWWSSRRRLGCSACDDLRALAGRTPARGVDSQAGQREHDQRTQETGSRCSARHAAASDGDAAAWLYGFLANRCLTIAGGTSEIQRNVIAERLLGLPKDP